jgi:nucleoside-diphosphate-sugar epimerase
MMTSPSQNARVLVTGASGHIGRALVACLRSSAIDFLATDIGDCEEGILPRDLRASEQVAKLFEMAPIRAVIHLAGILPSAFHKDPLSGSDLNLTASLNLFRHAIEHRVKRFVFASSLSVYGLTRKSARRLTEDDPAAPDEAYGGSKRAIELIGEALRNTGAIQFAALRIGRVIGAGIKKTSSPWRAQMFESGSRGGAISIPYAADAELCLIHVEDTARMLLTLAEAPAIRYSIYNAPTEIWTAHQLREMIEQTSGRHVDLGSDDAYAGATCEGSRFTQEFGFRLRGFKHLLHDVRS